MFSTNNRQGQQIWRSVYVQSTVPTELSGLYELSRNLWWSWQPEAHTLFQSMDPVLWEKYEHNPVAVMEELGTADYQRLANNKTFCTKLAKVYKDFRAYMDAPKAKTAPKIGYFCMEYGLYDHIKLYSGGLGVLAGDYLKEASDCNTDLVAIGLCYRYGYFKQGVSPEGTQMEEYRPQKFTYLPILPVRDENGEWKKISIPLPGRRLYAKLWRIDVGRVPLILMDTDIEENNPADRVITHHLYGGDREMRIKQELLLGIGGTQMLEDLKYQIDIFHSNEGHSAFNGLERLRKLVRHENMPIQVAYETVRSSSLFTTHTPVPAGHDRFEESLMRTYLNYMADEIGINWYDFMGLGREDAHNQAEDFNMSHLATHLSQEVNGVSKLHGEVTRDMFKTMFPGFDKNELNIGHVTNGVHYGTWTAFKFQELYEKTFGKGFLKNQADATNWEKIYSVPDEKIWEIRQELKVALIERLKQRLQKSMSEGHINPNKAFKLINTLNPNELIFGFARRFATYKRGSLLFTNVDRLLKIVNNSKRPVLFIFAGKAHPKDFPGKEFIRRIIAESEKPEFNGRVMFIEDYDMDLARHLVQGVDVWLNNPVRPMEASGTSGMKATMNGVLNLSVLDGWWAEGYVENAGWALPLKDTFDNVEYQNQLDAETIYRIIETEIAPLYYQRDENGIPKEWIQWVKGAISKIAPHFTMKRMLDEYHGLFYSKLQKRSNLLNANSLGKMYNLIEWKDKVNENWNHIKLVDLSLTDSQKPIPMDEPFKLNLTLDLGALSANDISVEVIFTRKSSYDAKERETVQAFNLGKGESNGHLVKYNLETPFNRSGVQDYGIRITPNHENMGHKTDLKLVTWF